MGLAVQLRGGCDAQERSCGFLVFPFLVHFLSPPQVMLLKCRTGHFIPLLKILWDLFGFWMESPVFNIQIPNSVFFTFSIIPMHSVITNSLVTAQVWLAPLYLQYLLLECSSVFSYPNVLVLQDQTASSQSRLDFTVPSLLLPFLLTFYILSSQLVFLRSRDFVSFIFASLVPDTQ